MHDGDSCKAFWVIQMQQSQLLRHAQKNALSQKCFLERKALFSYLMAQSDIVVALCLQIHNLTL